MAESFFYSPHPILLVSGQSNYAENLILENTTPGFYFYRVLTNSFIYDILILNRYSSLAMLEACYFFIFRSPACFSSYLAINQHG